MATSGELDRDGSIGLQASMMPTRGHRAQLSGEAFPLETVDDAHFTNPEHEIGGWDKDHTATDEERDAELAASADEASRRDKATREELARRMANAGFANLAAGVMSRIKNDPAA